MIWPDKKYIIKKNLKEQNFGEWEGLEFSKIPNIGFLNNFDLFKFKPPCGESNKDLLERVRSVIENVVRFSKRNSSLIVAHAGTIRAAIGLTIDPEWNCLDYHIDNLSITRIKILKNGKFSLIKHNIIF